MSVQSGENAPSRADNEMAVTVLVECREARSGRWVEQQWEAVAVVTGEDVASGESKSTLVHEDETSRRFLWSGLKVTLYRDACESYWYNLMSGHPFLYVVCNKDEYADEDDEDVLVPVLVTADQQEATGHMEVDDRVYSVPMPEQVHDWVERFVVQHYVPEQKKKRKRQNWAKEGENVEAADTDGPPVRH